MLEIFIYSLIISILFTPFGVFFIGNQHRNLYWFTKELIYGLVVLSFLAILFNFFYPLNIYINSTILLFFLIIFIKYKEYYLNFKFLKFTIILSFLITILITESNVYRPDAGLYHLPFIGILNSEKIIIGLSNLHFRYGHASIIQYLSAINNNLIFGTNGIVFAQAIIASSVIVNFTYQIFIYNKQKNYNFHFFFLIFVFIYMAYKMNRYSEYGNDAPAHFLVFFLVSELIKYKDNLNENEFLNHLTLSIFIILNKITLIPVLLYNLIYIRKINIKYIFLEKKIYFLILFFTSWIVKNILISGCLIYPISSTCISKLIWTNKAKTEQISIDAEAWSKGISDRNVIDSSLDYKDFNKDFNWLQSWSNKHLIYIINILYPYILFITLITLGICFFFKNKKDIFKDNSYFIFLFISLIGVLVWFLKAPIYRYGYSLIINSIVISFSIIVYRRNLSVNFLNKFSVIVMTLCLTTIVSKNILRIIKNDNNYYNYPWTKYFSMDKTNKPVFYEKKKLNYYEFLIPKKGEYCMYIDKICAHYGLDSKLSIIKIKNYNVLLYK